MKNYGGPCKPAGGVTLNRPQSSLVSSSIKVALASSIAIVPFCAALPVMAQSTRASSLANTNDDLIVVTAQRRDQSIQDVPYNISAVSGATLEKSGVNNVNSLTQIVAGLVTVDNGPAARGGTNNFTLRGLRTDNPSGDDNTPQTISSVSTYFGDVPVFFPLVLKDIDRVEVLRGPQGTLYGSGAEGGTIRFIPKRPNFKGISGEVNAGGGISDHSGKVNGNVDAVLNVPITPTLAVRAVGGITHLGGFIDAVDLLKRDGNGHFAPVVSANPASVTSAPVIAPKLKDVNSSNEIFGRLALRWKPVETIDLQLDYLHQSTKVDDIQASNPTYPGGVVDMGYAFGYPDSAYVKNAGGNYKNTFPIRQPSKNNIDLISATAAIDFGFATFTSVSSYVDNDTHGIYEYSTFWNNIPTGLGGAISNYGGFPRFIAVTEGDTHDKSFTQEVRLVSHWDKPVDYVIGAYFQNQKTLVSSKQTAPGIAAFGSAAGFPTPNPSSGDIVYNPVRNSHFLDRAVFGEVTWHITSKLQATGGARFFWQKFSYVARTTNDICGAPCSDGVTEPMNLGIVASSNVSKVNDHILKGNVAYDLSDNLKAYATYAEGFRRGGANGIPTTGYYRSLPIYQDYKPDVATTYEIGLKGGTPDHRFQFSADLYLINLNDFQFTANTPSYSTGVFNGNQARSKGGEIEATARLSSRLTISASYTFTDAKVSKGSSLIDYPVYSVVTGDAPYTYLTLSRGARLPGVPMHTVNGSVDYALPLGDKTLNGRLDASYRSDAVGAIATTDPFFWKIAPIFVLNGNLTLESNKRWSVDVFVNNISNAHGFTGSVGDQYVPNSFAGRTVMRPRTYGTQLHYRF